MVADVCTLPTVMRLCICMKDFNVCADDIPLERLVCPPSIIPVGAFWDELEAFFSDLVNELPDIPDGGNRYFAAHLKPDLGNTPRSAKTHTDQFSLPICTLPWSSQDNQIHMAGTYLPRPTTSSDQCAAYLTDPVVIAILQTVHAHAEAETSTYSAVPATC